MQGHIHRRVTKTRAGKEKITWYVVIEVGRTASGQRKQKWHGGYRTRKEAEAARAKIVNDFNNGTYRPSSSLTLSEFVNDQWLTTLKTQVKFSTYDSYCRNFRLHILPALGHRKLQDISTRVLNEFYAQALVDSNKRTPGGLSVKTVRYLHTTLHKALSDAIDLGLLSVNPAERAKPPKIKTGGTIALRFWSPEQLAMFLEKSQSHRLFPIWHLAAMTGMRRGELLGLRWSDVDWEHQRISVQRTLISVAYEIRESTPKTHKSRVIDVDKRTIEVLQSQRDGQQLERSTWGADYVDNDYVFAKENGTPLHPDQLTQSFERQVAKVEVPRIRLHDLRHTHATLGLRAGVPIKVMSERLGHESPAFTMKQYAHVIPGMQAEAAELIATLITGGQ